MASIARSVVKQASHCPDLSMEKKNAAGYRLPRSVLMRRPDKELMTLVQAFFRDHLASQKGVSSHTVIAYRDAVKLFLHSVARCARKPVSRVELDDLNARAALAFLNELETVRKNRVVTRNLRLAALRTFFMFLCAEDPLRAGEYQRVIAIPLKRATKSVMGYLEVKEIKAILGSVDRKRAAGERDYVAALATIQYRGACPGNL
jgi:site-specific recombinase XerD